MTCRYSVPGPPKVKPGDQTLLMLTCFLQWRTKPAPMGGNPVWYKSEIKVTSSVLPYYRSWIHNLIDGVKDSLLGDDMWRRWRKKYYPDAPCIFNRLWFIQTCTCALMKMKIRSKHGTGPLPLTQGRLSKQIIYKAICFAFYTQPFRGNEIYLKLEFMSGCFECQASYQRRTSLQLMAQRAKQCVSTSMELQDSG